MSVKQRFIDFVKQLPDSDYYLNNEDLLPSPDNIFASIIDNPVIVILGQDPYPRKESACGISFYDAAKPDNKTGKDVSIDNIIKELQIPGKVVYKTFFEHTQNNGVMWLNACLTYESKEAQKQHMKWWKPAINYLFSILPKNVIYILLGNEAQKYKAPGIVINGPHPSPMVYNKGNRIDLKQAVEEHLPGFVWYPAE